MKAIVDLMLRNASHSRVGKQRNTTSQIYKSRQEPGDNQTFSSLEQGDEYNLGTIQYPLDLGSNENGHYMLFYIYEQTQSKYAGSQVTSRVNEGTEKERAIRSAKEVGVQYSAKKDFSEPTLSPRSTERTMSGAAKTTGQTMKRTKDAIALYMPPSIQASYTIGYRDEETGIAGNIGRQMVATGGDILKTLGSENLFDQVTNQLKDTFTVKLIGAATDLVGMGNAEQVYRKATARALDPNLEAIFERVNQRTFNFNFSFFPKSQEEVEVIDKIIKLFKFHAHPERPVDPKLGRYLIFPSEFEMHYMYQGVENTWYPMISGCTLRSISVTYGNEHQTMRPIPSGGDGASPPPQRTNLSLSFQENEIMTKEKILEGF